MNILNKLHGLSPRSLLVTLDVYSLYTNLTHNEGIKPCEEALKARIDQSLPTDDLCSLVRLTFTKKHFYIFGYTNGTVGCKCVHGKV